MISTLARSGLGVPASRSVAGGQELPETVILVLSSHVEVEHAMELLASGLGIGYLLKTRVTDMAEFVETCSGLPTVVRSWNLRWCRSWYLCAGRIIRSLCLARESGRCWH